MHSALRCFSAIWMAVLLITSCSLPAPASQSAGTPTVPAQPPTPTPTSLPPLGPFAKDLLLWVAPAFAPDPETPAGALLADRLKAFEEQTPGVKIEVRVKSREGRGGLTESVLTAAVAAPEALPDLITLDPEGLHAAANHGLLVSLETSIPAPEADGWYEYALASTTIEGEYLAITFAGQTEVFAYRKDLFEAPPRRWEDLLSAGNAFVIPAGDPQARFTLAQYLALGGKLTDEAGEPMLQPDTLAKVLDFYRTSLDAGLLPITVERWSSPQQTWEELLANRTTAAVAPLESFLQAHDPARHAATAWPAGSENPISLAEPWSWSILSMSPEKEVLSGQLLEWLMDPAFLGPWTHALGMLPPNSATLAAWPEGPALALTSGLVTPARVMPRLDVRSTVGPTLQAAISAVLNGSNTPAGAAQQAADSLQLP